MVTPEILKAELDGLGLITMEEADLREARERRILLRQSIEDEKERISDIDSRREWTLRFDALNARLVQHQQEAQNASRAWASAGSERANVELWDRLQPIRPLYFKVQALQDMLARVREIYNEGEAAMQRLKIERDAARSAADVARQRLVDSQLALSARVKDFNVGYHIEGVINAIDKQLKQSDSALQQLQLTLNEKERRLQEIRMQEANAIKQTEEANTRVQGLSAHSVMLGMYDLVKDKLSAMGKERQLNEKLHMQQAEASRQKEMMQMSLRQHEGELTLLQREYDKCRSQLLILNQSCDTVLDVVRAPIIRDEEESRRHLDRFIDLRTQIRRLEEQLQIADLQRQTKREQLEKLSTEAAVADSHRLALEQAMRESDTEVGSLYADLDKIITLSGWFTEWQHNPDALRSRISNLYHEWQNSRARYAESSRNMAQLRSSLSAAEQSLAEARQQEIQQRNMRDALRRQLEDQREKLRATFGEKSPEETEKALTEDFRQASALCEEADKKLVVMQKDYCVIKSRQETIRDLQERLQEVLRNEGARLDLWLHNSNEDGKAVLQRPVMEEVFASKCDWKHLRQQLQDVEMRRTASNVRLEDSQREMNELQRMAGINKPGDEDTPAMLLQKRREAEQRLEKFQTELREVEGKVYAHEMARRKMDNLRVSPFGN